MSLCVEGGEDPVSCVLSVCTGFPVRRPYVMRLGHPVHTVTCYVCIQGGQDPYDTPHLWMSHDAFECGNAYTGWPRPIGCLKLQVNFHKRASDYKALLRKMTYKDKASYGSSPPCIVNTCP